MASCTYNLINLCRKKSVVPYSSVEEDCFEDKLQNMYAALCLTCCWKPALPSLLEVIWLKTAAMVTLAIADTVQLSY